MKIGLIGLGHWGKTILKVLQSLHQQVYLYDIHQAKHLGASPNIQWIGLEDMLHNKDIHAVIIATPAQSHASIAKKALRHKKHIYIEKPMCTKLKDAYQLSTLAHQHKRILMLGHLLHQHPLYQSIQIKHPESSLKRLCLYRLQNNSTSSQLSISQYTNWLWDLGPHAISILHMLTPSIIHTPLTRLKTSLHLQRRPYPKIIIHIHFGLNLEIYIHLSKQAAPYRGIVLTTQQNKLQHFIEKKTRIINPLEKQMAAFLHAINLNQNSIPSITHGLHSVQILSLLEKRICPL